MSICLECKRHGLNPTRGTQFSLTVTALGHVLCCLSDVSCVLHYHVHVLKYPRENKYAYTVHGDVRIDILYRLVVPLLIVMQGFTDPVYKARRTEFADIAYNYKQ